ncbi:hypothetical protein EDC04DRAFT_261600 [Pisolithus marmoratus]|nr:hypothetical protein EDC04DRAFT_261600 [Pisolithus marmoratus]
MTMDANKQGKWKPRTLVLCFDGTRDKFDGDNTNVVKLFALLERDKWNEQRCYYQPGVGTYFEPGVVSPLFSWGARILDEAIAWYIHTHVMDGYKFLMANYRTGDKICLFGFSRGAYTARALAGMLAKVGLLPRDNLQSVTFAYKYYKREDKEGEELAEEFKKTFCQEVHVEFVGVWDTVQSTGIVMSRSLPFTDTNMFIKTFRQALALDERRAKYEPNLYGQSSKNQKSNSAGDKTATNGTSGSGTEQRVLEVWFAGGHCDIGGGNVKDEEKNSLAQITLRWMIKQIKASDCGIQFKDEAPLTGLGFPLRPVPAQAGLNGAVAAAPGVEQGDIANVALTSDSHPRSSSPTGMADLELKDATAHLFDYLHIKSLRGQKTVTWPWVTCAFWWLLEIIPLPSSGHPDEDGRRPTRWSIHLGRRRKLPAQASIHHTVGLRKEHVPSYKLHPKCGPDGDVKWLERE